MDNFNGIVDRLCDISLKAAVSVKEAGESASRKVDLWRLQRDLSKEYASLGVRVYDAVSCGMEFDSTKEEVVLGISRIRELLEKIDAYDKKVY